MAGIVSKLFGKKCGACGKPVTGDLWPRTLASGKQIKVGFCCKKAFPR